MGRKRKKAPFRSGTEVLFEKPDGPVVVLSFSGYYPPGSDGNHIAAEMVRQVEAVVRDFLPSAVIFDMRELRYTWGDAIAGIIIPILLKKDKPISSCLIAKGSTARCIADLMKGSVLGNAGPLFSSLEEAVNYIEGELAAQKSE